MKVLYIDIETTGLDCVNDDILEIGMVMDDLRVQSPIETLPQLRLYVEKERYSGNAYALAMNAAILSKIAKKADANIVREYDVFNRVWHFFTDNKFPTTISVGGKNVAGFDLPFIGNLAGFKKSGSMMQVGEYKFRHRTIDPTILYYDPEVDEFLPDLKSCCRRAGIDSNVAHTTIEDCLMVAQLVRLKFPITRSASSVCLQ